MSVKEEIIREIRRYDAHDKQTRCVALGGRSAQVMITGGDDMLIKFWSLDRPKPLMTLSGHSSSVEAISFNKSELRIASGCASGALKVWDLETEKLMRSLKGHKSGLQCIDFHPLGEFTASGSADYTVKLWDLNRKGCINTYKGHSSNVTCVQFSPDGKWLMSADDSGQIKLWDLIAGKQLCDLNKHTAAITGLEFHPSEFILATGSLDRTIKFWDLEKNELLTECANDNEVVSAIRFHPEGQCLYVAGEERVSVSEWEPQRCLHSIALPTKHKTAYLSVCNQQLIGAQLNGAKVSVYTVDIEKLPPFTKASGDKPDKRLSTTGRKTFVAGSSADPAKKHMKEVAENDDDESDISKVKVEDPEYCKQVIQNARANQKKEQSDGSKSNNLNQNARPALVEVEDFMKNPASAYGDQSKLSDQSEPEVLQQIKKGHAPIVSVLSNRHRHLRLISSEWESSVKKSIETAISMKEPSVVIDLLDVLLHRLSLWNLDICVVLLPVLSDLVQSKYDYYISISLSTLRHIIKNFGSLIKSCILVPPSAMIVDLAREDRYKKCLHCYQALTRIRGDLDQRLHRYPGRLGEKVREIHGLIVQMK